MFPGGASTKKVASSNKSESEHSSAPKKGFLLSFFDDDSSSDDSTQKSQSNSKRLESFFDNGSNNSVDENSNKSQSTLESSKPINNNSASLNIPSNLSFYKVNQTPQNPSIGSLNFQPCQRLPLSNSNYPNNNYNQTDEQIKYLKNQMKMQQEQIQFLLQQQQQTPTLPFTMNNFNPINTTTANNNFFNESKTQETQNESEVLANTFDFNSNLTKAETKSSSSKVTSFDFSRGDAPSFSVKFNFGTGKQFTSKTNPSKTFLSFNFKNKTSFSKSKSDNTNKKGGADYTDSFLFKIPKELNKSNQNEKNILQIQDIKLFILMIDKNEKKFSLISRGKIFINVINNINRIIVRNNQGNCIFNSRILPKMAPIINNKSIQIIGQNFGAEKSTENNNDKRSDKAEKENILSIYRIVFPTVEKAKEFFQCISLIK